MDLGPFSIVFVLPRIPSTSLSSFKRSSGERVVSTCYMSDLVPIASDHRISLT